MSQHDVARYVVTAWSEERRKKYTLPSLYRPWSCEPMRRDQNLSLWPFDGYSVLCRRWLVFPATMGSRGFQGHDQDASRPLMRCCLSILCKCSLLKPDAESHDTGTDTAGASS